MAVAICYRMDARVSIADIRAISVVAKPSHVITVSLFNSVCFTYITYYSIAYVTFLVCVCTMVLGFRNQLVSRELCYLAIPFGCFMAPKADELLAVPGGYVLIWNNLGGVSAEAGFVTIPALPVLVHVPVPIPLVPPALSVVGILLGHWWDQRKGRRWQWQGRILRWQGQGRKRQRKGRRWRQ